MSNYALVENGIVVNIIVWDGVAYTPATDDTPAFGWSPPEGETAILLPDDSPITFGFTYDGTTFTAPAVVVPVLTPAQILSINTATQSALIANATLKIAVLTDATDPDIVDTVDPADVAALKAWKQYRVAVSKIDLTQSAPTWPIAPA